MSTGQSNKVVFGLAEAPAAAGLLVTGDERLALPRPPHGAWRSWMRSDRRWWYRVLTVLLIEDLRRSVRENQASFAEDQASFAEDQASFAEDQASFAEDQASFAEDQASQRPPRSGQPATAEHLILARLGGVLGRVHPDMNEAPSSNRVGALLVGRTGLEPVTSTVSR